MKSQIDLIKMRKIIQVIKSMEFSWAEILIYPLWKWILIKRKRLCIEKLMHQLLSKQKSLKQLGQLSSRQNQLDLHHHFHLNKQVRFNLRMQLQDLQQNGIRFRCLLSQRLEKTMFKIFSTWHLKEKQIMKHLWKHATVTPLIQSVHCLVRVK